jgi:hypothetical protein
VVLSTTVVPEAEKLAAADRAQRARPQMAARSSA